MKLDRFINRPVLSTVISIIIVILGILGLVSLPVSQYPDIAPPTVRVSATYTGANAQTVLNSVVAPLEEQINGVEGMTYMTSEATSDGSASITVYFQQGVDPDMAAVNVQNRVSMATGLLPAEVTQIGVTTQKRQTIMLLIFTLTSPDDSYDAIFLNNYLQINVRPQIMRVPGVGDAMVWGSDYSMRIWLKPDVMSQYKLVPSDITNVLAEQNLEAAERLASGPGHFNDDGAQLLPGTGRLQRQRGSRMLHALQMGVELHDAPFQKGKAFEDGVSPMHHMVVQRHQQESCIPADGAHAVLVKGRDIRRARARQLQKLRRPGGGVENGNRHDILSQSGGRARIYRHGNTPSGTFPL